MEISFKGKRALVTGATKGIGRQIAIKLSKCGAQVVAIGRTKDLLESLKAEYPSIEIIQVDLADWKQTKKTLQNQMGPIDLLVNNAGMGLVKPITDMCEEDVDSVLAVNVKSVLNVTNLVVCDLLTRKSTGSIVNLSSQASMAGLLNHSIYCASKGAIDAFTRASAVELGPKGIRINAVNPTVVMTEMGKLGWSDETIARPMREKIPLRRFSEVDEVVNAVLYLLSDKASMITGVCLPIDGGFLSG